VEPVGPVEQQLARHLAGRALLVMPVVVLAAGLLRGWDGALGAAIGLAIVVANFALAASAATWAARLGPGALAGASLGGYVVRLAIVFGALFALKGVDAVDMAALVLTLAFSHLALLALEVRSVRITLADPGLATIKPLPADLATKE
jgi:hypothetical protein